MAEVLANYQFCESRLVSRTYHIEETFHQVVLFRERKKPDHRLLKGFNGTDNPHIVRLERLQIVSVGSLRDQSTTRNH